MSPIFTYAAELYREMRDEFELSIEAAHAAAEEGTHGAMLNKHGRAEGIDAYSLMTGPWSRVERYGSPELIEWCEENGRPSVARFEREWFASWQGDLPEPDAVEYPADGVMRTADLSGTQRLTLSNLPPGMASNLPCADPANHSQPCSCSALELLMPDYDKDSPEYREAERRFNEAHSEHVEVSFHETRPTRHAADC